MAHPAVSTCQPDTRPPDLIVDLDALLDNIGDEDEPCLVPWSPPAVIDGEVVTHPRFVSPLDGQDVLHGGVVTDPDEMHRIAARVEYGQLPMWVRFFTPTPEGWR